MLVRSPFIVLQLRFYFLLLTTFQPVVTVIRYRSLQARESWGRHQMSCGMHIRHKAPSLRSSEWLWMKRIPAASILMYHHNSHGISIWCFRQYLGCSPRSVDLQQPEVVRLKFSVLPSAWASSVVSTKPREFPAAVAVAGAERSPRRAGFKAVTTPPTLLPGLTLWDRVFLHCGVCCAAIDALSTAGSQR